MLWSYKRSSFKTFFRSMWLAGALVCAVLPTAAFAETEALSQANANILWTLLAAFLVMFRQAGFAMVETGLTRAKNASNILMKNLMDFSAGAVVFWALGWGLMYGADALGGFLGSDGFFLAYTAESMEGYGVSDMSAIFRDWMFQVVFAATAATIVSGAMAERTKFSAYLVYSVFISGLLYPISGH